MSENDPFVVVVAGATEKVGKSTIAKNLAVYLKALQEDLPVTLVSFENGSGLDAMFLLGNEEPGDVAELFTVGNLETVTRMGQFGVDYLSSEGALPVLDDSTRLRRILSRDRRAGVVVVDAGNEMGELWRNAIWAADLILSPIGNQRSLSRLNALRRTLLEGGGTAEMLWLLPSRLGVVEDTEPKADAHQLLRFAADERGCQVLAQELSEDQRVHLQASGQDRSILTRLPGSYVHEELRQLATFVLQKFAEGPVVECRSRRMLDDGLLPERARRVDLACPLCGKPAFGLKVHYLETFPNRYRALLHANCLERLLDGTSLHAFLPMNGQLLIETGIEGQGLRGEIRLHLSGYGEDFVEQQQLRPENGTGWESLLRTVTGRGLNEQYPGLLAISVEGEAAALLRPERHRLYSIQRRDAFRKLHRRVGF